MSEMTPEEPEAYNESIPERKREALVVSDAAEEEEEQEKGIFGRAKDSVKQRISSTESAQNFYKSDEYQQIEKLRSEYSEFKNELKDQIDNSQSPLI